MDTNKLLESISKKLGALIALNLVSMNSEVTTKESVEMLDRFGLTPTEIAEILNISTNSVNVTRNRIKNNKNK